MSREPGSVPITGFLSPTDIEDNYPTHKDIYGYGGYRSVATLTERDAIDVTSRSIGMQVYVVEDSSVYSLQDIEGNDWIKMYGIVNGVPDYNIDDTDLGTLTLPHNYIYQGDLNNKPVTSSSLIDMTIDQIAMQNQIAQVYGAHVVLTSPSVAFPNGTILNTTTTKREYLYVQDGNVASSHRLALSSLPPILNGHVVVGNGEFTVIERPYELNAIPANAPVDFGGYPAVNSDDAIEPTDLTTLQQVESLVAAIPDGMVSLNGVISGSGLADGSSIITSFVPEAFTEELGYNSLATLKVVSNLDMNMFNIVNLQDANDPLHAVNRRTAQEMIEDRTTNIVGAVMGSAQGNNPINVVFDPTSFAGELSSNNLAVFSPSEGDYDMGGYKIANAADAVDTMDLVPLGQVESLIAASGDVPISITGAISGTGNSGSTAISTIYNSATFSAQLGTHSISRMLPPDANVDFNNKRLTNVANATANSNAVNYGQFISVLTTTIANSLTANISFATLCTNPGASSTRVTTMPTANTFALMSYVLNSSECLYANNFFINGAGRITKNNSSATAANTQMYGSCSFVSNTTGTISIAVYYNGFLYSKSMIAVKQVTAGVRDNLALGGFIQSMVYNDYIELYVSHSVAGATFTLTNLCFTVADFR